jgi:hypothetical protein
LRHNFHLPPTNRSGPDRLAADHETGKLLLDYADDNSCLLFGPDNATTNPYNPIANPDVLDIVITKNLPSQVYLTSCSALSSDHLQVLTDTGCHSSFRHLRDRADFRRTDWANFQTHLPCPFQSVYQRHALALAPRRVSTLRGRQAFIATSRKRTLPVSYLEP